MKNLKIKLFNNNFKLNNKNGFTLVELIVVITILAILGTIAFLAFKGYAASSRDTKRISDIKSIRTSLELFGLNTGKFPDPNNPYQVTFSGSEIRSQGIFGEQNLRNVGNINKLPIDPLTELEYTYSVTHSKNEFELGAILETNDILSFNEIQQANALNKKKAIAYIKGNYNGRLLRKKIGNTTYILAIPSIINGDYSLSDIIDLINAKKLVYNGYGNLPASYTGTTFEVYGEDDLDLINPSELVVFSGSIEDLINPDDSNSRIELIQNIKEAYLGTDLENQEGIEEIINLELNDTNNPTSIEENIAGILVNNEFGGKIEVTSVSIPSNSGICESSIFDHLDFYFSYEHRDKEKWCSNLLTCINSTFDHTALNTYFKENKTKELWCSQFVLYTDFYDLASEVPTEIGYLINLTSIDLYYIGINSLPESLGNLVNLEYLTLYENNITSLPESIGNLTNLHTLHLFSNNLTSLPESLGNLVNLEYLTLYENNLETLPDSITNLKKLKQLMLSDNPSLGNLSDSFDIPLYYTDTRSQDNITPTGKTIAIYGEDELMIISNNIP